MSSDKNTTLAERIASDDALAKHYAKSRDYLEKLVEKFHQTDALAKTNAPGNKILRKIIAYMEGSVEIPENLVRSESFKRYRIQISSKKGSRTSTYIPGLYKQKLQQDKDEERALVKSYISSNKNPRNPKEHDVRDILIGVNELMIETGREPISMNSMRSYLWHNAEDLGIERVYVGIWEF